MKKIIIISILIWQASISFSQIVFSDSTKRIKGINYKISYATNNSKKDTLKFVYYGTDDKICTDEIITLPPNSCAITGFTPSKSIVKFQAKTDKEIINELDNKKIEYDKDKIKEEKDIKKDDVKKVK
jgi:hypothetical protein